MASQHHSLDPAKSLRCVVRLPVLCVALSDPLRCPVCGYCPLCVTCSSLLSALLPAASPLSARTMAVYSLRLTAKKGQHTQHTERRNCSERHASAADENRPIIGAAHRRWICSLAALLFVRLVFARSLPFLPLLLPHSSQSASERDERFIVASLAGGCRCVAATARRGCHEHAGGGAAERWKQVRALDTSQHADAKTNQREPSLISHRSRCCSLSRLARLLSAGLLVFWQFPRRNSFRRGRLLFLLPSLWRNPSGRYVDGGASEHQRCGRRWWFVTPRHSTPVRMHRARANAGAGGGAS